MKRKRKGRGEKEGEREKEREGERERERRERVDHVLFRTGSQPGQSSRLAANMQPVSNQAQRVSTPVLTSASGRR